MLDKAGVVPLRAEDRLREYIVTGRLQPNERLVESDLARSMGVSRTIIRAALVRLEHEGLVACARPMICSPSQTRTPSCTGGSWPSAVTRPPRA